MTDTHRRRFLGLAGLGGVAYTAGLFGGCAAAPGAAANEDFHFVQLSDAHWGYQGDANPEARTALPRAVAAVNALAEPPDFICFSGDLTHSTDDPKQRRQRMAEFRDIVSGLRVKTVHFMPGENDASLDGGEAFREFFGPTHYAFDHKGVHFIVLDNVSDPRALIGEVQLAWLAAELERRPPETRTVVLTHRPLFDLYPQWDWATRDGARAIDLLMPHPNVVVFYGHIHQELHSSTGHIAHHSAQSLIFPLPAPGSQPRRTPVPWNPAQPFHGLGFREVDAQPGATQFPLQEFPLAGA